MGKELDSDLKEEVARKRLHEVSDRYDMGIEDVDIEFDPTMPYNVLGRTTTERYGDSDLKVVVGDSFLESSEPEQLRTMAHEGFHVKQFRGEEADWLQEQFDVSEDFSREVERSWKSGDLDDIEGMTSLVVDNLVPFGSSGYPYEKRKKEKELEARGIDVESELLDDIETELYDTIESYKQVHESFRDGDLYFEEGEIGGFSYTAVSIGVYGSEEEINDYLAEFVSGDHEDMWEDYSSSRAASV